MCKIKSRFEKFILIYNLNYFLKHDFKQNTTRNSTFWHNFFGHEYNFVSKDNFGRQNLSLLQKLTSKI